MNPKLSLLAAVLLSGAAQAQQGDMTFFVTSVGSGRGADFGDGDGRIFCFAVK